MLNCKYLRSYQMAINGKNTKNYHKISGAADSLYSNVDLFFAVQADVGGGLQIIQLLCPLQRLLAGILLSTN